MQWAHCALKLTCGTTVQKPTEGSSLPSGELISRVVDGLYGRYCPARHKYVACMGLPALSQSYCLHGEPGYNSPHTIQEHTTLQCMPANRLPRIILCLKLRLTYPTLPHECWLKCNPSCACAAWRCCQIGGCWSRRCWTTKLVSREARLPLPTWCCCCNMLPNTPALARLLQLPMAGAQPADLQLCFLLTWLSHQSKLLVTIIGLYHGKHRHAALQAGMQLGTIVWITPSGTGIAKIAASSC